MGRFDEVAVGDVAEAVPSGLTVSQTSPLHFQLKWKYLAIEMEL